MGASSRLTLTGEQERCAAASRRRGEATAGTLGHFDIGVFIEGFAPFPRLALESIAPRLYAFNLETWRRFSETGDGLHPRFLPIRRDRPQKGGSFAVFFSLPVPGRSPLQLRYDLADYESLCDFDFVAMRDRPLDSRYLLTCRAVEPTSPMRLRFDAA